MKIRKTPVMDGQAPANVYIYENRKEEYIVIAIPALEWSFSFAYEEEAEAVAERLEASLKSGLTMSAPPSWPCGCSAGRGKCSLEGDRGRQRLCMLGVR